MGVTSVLFKLFSHPCSLMSKSLQLFTSIFTNLFTVTRATFWSRTITLYCILTKLFTFMDLDSCGRNVCNIQANLIKLYTHVLQSLKPFLNLETLYSGERLRALGLLFCFYTDELLASLLDAVDTWTFIFACLSFIHLHNFQLQFLLHLFSYYMTNLWNLNCVISL